MHKYSEVSKPIHPVCPSRKTGFRNKELRDLVPEANTSASLVPRMIAASPEEFRRIAGLFRESGYRRADINLGCPFPMQARQHRGAGILPYPDEVKVLLETIFEFPEIQFSVKLRLGWDSPEEAQALLPFFERIAPHISHCIPGSVRSNIKGRLT